jgi:hypothetical protein
MSELSGSVAAAGACARGSGPRCRAAWRNPRRRGAALLMALFALGVAATAATSFSKSRDRSIDVGSSVGEAARARLAAAEGLAISREVLASIFQEPDAIKAAAWRSQLADGILLSNYAIDGAILDVTVRDLNTGLAPTLSTTEFDARISVSVGETSYRMNAQMSLRSLVKGQYALFANKFMTMEGRNFIGRWERAPRSADRDPVNMGTQADLQQWGFSGVYINGNAMFEDRPVSIPGTHSGLIPALFAHEPEFKRAARTGYAMLTSSDPTDPVQLWKFAGGDYRSASSWERGEGATTTPQTYLYYPYQAQSPTIWGDGKDLVEKERLPQGESIRMTKPPNEPTFTTGTTYWGNKSWSGTTATLNPFRVRCLEFFGIPISGGDLNVSNSTLTLKSGVYRIDDKLKLTNSTLIIDGNVKIVMKARMWFDLDAKSLEMVNSTIQLKGNSQLLLFVAYDLSMSGSWIGKQHTCAASPNAPGDPHMRAWMGSWEATACEPDPPLEPQYIEPWRVRIYPDPAFLSSIFLWDFVDTSIVGSIFMPTNPVILRGRTEIYGRIAANHVLMRDDSAFFYDHALDDITGLTEGAPPPRGGTQQIPTRIQLGF